MTENAALFMIGPAFLTDTAGFGIMAAFLVSQKLFQKKMAGDKLQYASCLYLPKDGITLEIHCTWEDTIEFRHLSTFHRIRLAAPKSFAYLST